MPDAKIYEAYQKEQEEWHESICKRCGRCCGAGGNDPCRNLVKFNDGAYFCKIYPNRLGEQETINGRKFNCVLVREVTKYMDVIPECAYRK